MSRYSDIDRPSYDAAFTLGVAYAKFGDSKRPCFDHVTRRNGALPSEVLKRLEKVWVTKKTPKKQAASFWFGYRYETKKPEHNLDDCIDFVRERFPTLRWVLERTDKRGLQAVWKRCVENGLNEKNDPNEATETALRQAEEAAENAQQFDPQNGEDARTKTLRALVDRRGQPKFRKELLAAYEDKCAITGCDSKEALEAAHIRSYNGDETNHVTNGLLLRADIHTLFDLHLIEIDDQYKVRLSPELESSVYAKWSRKRLRLPQRESEWPSRPALAQHREKSVPRT